MKRYSRNFVACFALLLMAAVLVTPALGQVTEGFENGIPASWTFSGPAGLDGTADSTSGLSPTQGSYYGWISTGCSPGGQPQSCPTVANTPDPGYGSLATGSPVLGTPTVETTLTSSVFSFSNSGTIAFDVNFITTDGTYGFADYAVVTLIPSGDAPRVALFVANTTCANCNAVPPQGLTGGAATLYPETASFTGTGVTFGGTTYGNIPAYSGGNGGPSGWINVSYPVSAGSYQLQFLVAHVGDTSYPSALAIDNLQTPLQSETQTLSPGVQAIYTFNNDKVKITPSPYSLGNESLTFTAVPIPKSSFIPPANFPNETCVPFADYSTDGIDRCVEFQADCTGADCSTLLYELAESYDLPPDLPAIGGPDFLVVHGKGCPTSGSDLAQSIFTEYFVTRIDPTTKGGGAGTGSCFEVMYTPTAAPITSGRWTGTAYVANAGSNSVSVINTSTNSVASTVSVGFDPVDIALAPIIASAYVANAFSNSVSVIDTATNTVAATVGVGRIPVNVAVTPDGTKAYVANSGSESISVINTSTNAVITTVEVGRSPVDIAISPNGSTAYIANTGSNSLSVINTATNTVAATVGVGSIPVNVAVTPDGTKAYVANSGSRSISVINTGTNKVIATVKVGYGPVEVAISSDGSTAYVANAGSNSVSVINTSSNAVLTTLAVGFFPVNLTISPDGTHVYVVNAFSNSVSVINTATKAVVSTVPVGFLPANAGITAGNLYVANGGAHTVSVISTSSNSVTATVSVGSNPVNVGVP